MTWHHSHSLHHIEEGKLNPYQQVISIIGRTLEGLTRNGNLSNI